MLCTAMVRTIFVATPDLDNISAPTNTTKVTWLAIKCMAKAYIIPTAKRFPVDGLITSV